MQCLKNDSVDFIICDQKSTWNDIRDFLRNIEVDNININECAQDFLDSCIRKFDETERSQASLDRSKRKLVSVHLSMLKTNKGIIEKSIEDALVEEHKSLFGE